MNKFELKLKLKNAYPVISGDVVKEIIANAEFINKDVQAMIDRSVSSVKNLFTVQTIDVYAEKLMTYTQDFLDKLDKLGVHWLICQLPTGLNFYSDEMNNVFSEPFVVSSAWTAGHINYIRKTGKDKTFMMYGISEEKLADSTGESAYIIRGKLVRKSIFSKLQE